MNETIIGNKTKNVEYKIGDNINFLTYSIPIEKALRVKTVLTGVFITVMYMYFFLRV